MRRPRLFLIVCRLALLCSVLLSISLAFMVGASLCSATMAADRLLGALDSQLELALFAAELAFMAAMSLSGTRLGISKAAVLVTSQRYQRYVAPLTLLVMSLGFSSGARPVGHTDEG